MEWFRSPDRLLGSLWQKIPGYLKLTFAASMVLGLASHLFIFTNRLPNHDDIGGLFGNTYGTASGRWFLPVVLQWDGDYSMPWLIGLLSLLCLAGAVCFTVELLRIRRPVGCILTAALMTAFPTVAATFSYMFTADAYFFSLLLAAFAAWAADRLRWWAGVPLGAAAVALSMGIYQSYFPVAAALMVGSLFFQVTDGKKSFKDLILKGVQLVSALGLGMAAYLVIVRITTRGTGLVDYMGISEMGKLSLDKLPELIGACYGKYYIFFVDDFHRLHFDFLPPLLIAAAIAALVLAVLLLVRRHADPLRTALGGVLLVLFPLAADLIYLMVNGGGVHLLMLYGTVLTLVFPLGLMDYLAQLPEESSSPPPPRARLVQVLLRWLLVITLSLTAYSYMVTDNRAYMKVEVSFDQCYAYSNRLLSAIESCPGYWQGMPVVLVGNNLYEYAMFPTPELNDIVMTGIFSIGDYRTNYTYGLYLRYFLGFAGPVYLDAYYPELGFAARPEVVDMPCYPQAGGVQVIDNFVIVKLN